MISAIEFPPQQPHLTEFSAYLNDLKFPHRLSEHDGMIVLWVYEESHVEIAIELYHRFQLLPEQLSLVKYTQSADTGSAIGSVPVTLAMIMLSIAGFFVVSLQALSLLSWISFQGFDVVDGSLQINAGDHVKELIVAGQWWRLATPAFLHFDIMHITFNATVLWFLGSQLEQQQGSLKFLAYVLLMAVISNTAQFFYSPDYLFGGMSGVNYGLLGYCGLLNFWHKKSCFNLPPGFFVVSVISMLLGFFGFFSLFGYEIANWAHLAGFLAGIVLALLAKKEKKVVL